MATVRYKANYSNQTSREVFFKNIPKATALRISELHKTKRESAWLIFILSTIAGVHNEVLWTSEIQAEFDFWIEQ